MCVHNIMYKIMITYAYYQLSYSIATTRVLASCAVVESLTYVIFQM